MEVGILEKMYFLKAIGIEPAYLKVVFTANFNNSRHEERSGFLFRTWIGLVELDVFCMAHRWSVGNFLEPPLAVHCDHS